MSYRCAETGDRSGFRGCGRNFSALREFDRHFVKAAPADDPRRNAYIIGVDGYRCATDAELARMGIVQRERDGKWWDQAQAERLSNHHGNVRSGASRRSSGAG